MCIATDASGSGSSAREGCAASKYKVVGHI